jgi:hypothetical protein
MAGGLERQRNSRRSKASSGVSLPVLPRRKKEDEKVSWYRSCFFFPHREQLFLVWTSGSIS